MLYLLMFISLVGEGLAAAPEAAAKDLHLYAGAGLRQPLDQLVEEFQAETGHRVYTDFSGSGQLLTKIQAGVKGDVFIPGALFYIERLQKKGLVETYRPIVFHTPVIGVNVKQAHRITSFDDLAKPGIRLAMGDPKAMAFGRTTLNICEKSGRKAAILKNVTVYGATVKQLALYVAQGAVDAAIIGRSDAFQNRSRITMVDIPPEYFIPETVAAAVLKSTKDEHLADALCRYLSSDHGVSVFKTYGFLPLNK